MATLYDCPKHIRNNKDSQQEYYRQLRKTLNQSLDNRISNEETFSLLVGKVFDRCCSAQEFRVWFSPHLVSKIAGKVSAEWVHNHESIDRHLANPKKKEIEERTGNPFTLESCDAHIAETQAMIDSGELPAALGNMLIRIPKKAKERLLTGQTPDTKNE
tara:strand:+ start:156 stop:632 length:477 start_codon:yes stop_codon:yes gene_type:complete